jgi:hypothetical protein
MYVFVNRGVLYRDVCCTLLLACNVPNPGCTNYLQDQLMDNKSSFSVYSLLLNKNTDASDVMWVAIGMQLLVTLALERICLIFYQ